MFYELIMARLICKILLLKLPDFNANYENLMKYEIFLKLQKIRLQKILILNYQTFKLKSIFSKNECIDSN